LIVNEAHSAVPAAVDNGAPGVAGRPAVVLLHGVGGGKAQWAPQLAQFADAGWHAIAWDMPGYGESAALGEFTFAGLAASLAALLDQHGMQQAIIVGQSMGGMVALEACARFPGRIAGLVLACTSARFGSSDGAWQRGFIAERVAPLDAGRGMPWLAADQIPKMMTRAASRAVRDAAIAVMSDVPESTYRRALECLLTFDRRSLLALIDTPTLVLAAAADVQAPPATMEKMAGRIHAAEFVMLADCAHLANFERPELFGSVVCEFLARRCT
jgi:pimeloyl-ACP methyl ester carboxylesterase